MTKKLVSQIVLVTQTILLWVFSTPLLLCFLFLLSALMETIAIKESEELAKDLYEILSFLFAIIFPLIPTIVLYRKFVKQAKMYVYLILVVLQYPLFLGVLLLIVNLTGIKFRM